MTILDHLILVTKNWSNNACVGCNGAYKLMDMIDFLTSKSNIIEEKKRSSRNETFLKNALI
jgi:hypothetical protein